MVRARTGHQRSVEVEERGGIETRGPLRRHYAIPNQTRHFACEMAACYSGRRLRPIHLNHYRITLAAALCRVS